MKNKTKKILAGACLGLVGMGALSGCAMSDNQKKEYKTLMERQYQNLNSIKKT